MTVAMLGICVPSIILGPSLILIFGIWLEVLPVSGWGDFSGDKILPTITLGTAYAAYCARLTRGGMLEVLNQDFILKEFLRKGGLRCQIISSSSIKVGDIIKILD